MDPKETARLMGIIMAAGHSMGYQRQSSDELEALGLTGFPAGTFEYDPKQKQMLACTVVAPGETLTLPDNETGPCAWGCGRTVQFRPWVAAGLTRVCLYCLAARPPGKDQ